MFVSRHHTLTRSHTHTHNVTHTHTHKHHRLHLSMCRVCLCLKFSYHMSWSFVRLDPSSRLIGPASRWCGENTESSAFRPYGAPLVHHRVWEPSSRWFRCTIWVHPLGFVVGSGNTSSRRPGPICPRKKKTVESFVTQLLILRPWKVIKRSLLTSFSRNYLSRNDTESARENKKTVEWSEMGHSPVLSERRVELFIIVGKALSD